MKNRKYNIKHYVAIGLLCCAIILGLNVSYTPSLAKTNDTVPTSQVIKWLTKAQFKKLIGKSNFTIKKRIGYHSLQDTHFEGSAPNGGYYNNHWQSWNSISNNPKKYTVKKAEVEQLLKSINKVRDDHSLQNGKNGPDYTSYSNPTFMAKVMAKLKQYEIDPTEQERYNHDKTGKNDAEWQADKKHAKKYPEAWDLFILTAISHDLSQRVLPNMGSQYVTNAGGYAQYKDMGYPTADDEWSSIYKNGRYHAWLSTHPSHLGYLKGQPSAVLIAYLPDRKLNSDESIQVVYHHGVLYKHKHINVRMTLDNIKVVQDAKNRYNGRSDVWYAPGKHHYRSIEISPLFGRGIWLNGVTSVEAHYEFFDDNGKDINLTPNQVFGVNSLDGVSNNPHRMGGHSGTIPFYNVLSFLRKGKLDYGWSKQAGKYANIIGSNSVFGYTAGSYRGLVSDLYAGFKGNMFTGGKLNSYYNNDIAKSKDFFSHTVYFQGNNSDTLNVLFGTTAGYGNFSLSTDMPKPKKQLQYQCKDPKKPTFKEVNLHPKKSAKTNVVKDNISKKKMAKILNKALAKSIKSNKKPSKTLLKLFQVNARKWSKLEAKYKQSPKKVLKMWAKYINCYPGPNKYPYQYKCSHKPISKTDQPKYELDKNGTPVKSNLTAHDIKKAIKKALKKHWSANHIHQVFGVDDSKGSEFNNALKTSVNKAYNVWKTEIGCVFKPKTQCPPCTPPNINMNVFFIFYLYNIYVIGRKKTSYF